MVVRASKAEARTTNASLEAIRVVADVAAELVKTAALEVCSNNLNNLFNLIYVH